MGFGYTTQADEGLLCQLLLAVFRVLRADMKKPRWVGGAYRLLLPFLCAGLAGCPLLWQAKKAPPGVGEAFNVQRRWLLGEFLRGISERQVGVVVVAVSTVLRRDSYLNCGSVDILDRFLHGRALKGMPVR